MRTKSLILALVLFAFGFGYAADPVPPTSQFPDQTAQSGEIAENPGAVRIDSLPVDADKSINSGLRPAMMDELREMREEEQLSVIDLTNELMQTVSQEERMELQKRISEIKSDATLQSMAIQLKYARLGGFDEQIQRLEVDIELFVARRDAPPAPINTSSARDLKSRGGQSR